jgi:energy-coupling factor transport system ATP-binding protein
MAYIELKDVSYKYPYTKRKALKNISCRFEKGGFYGIIGQNGGGKTTLCNVVRGLIPHFYQGELTGEVMIDGTEVRDCDTGELSAKIGYVFQNPFTQISGIKETVFEEVAMGTENMGVEKRQMIETVLQVCDRLKIIDLLEKNPTELSGGQRQRVAFASIIAMDSEMLVIDEPTSQLDPQGTEDVFTIIDALKQSGKTILLVEHKINLIAQYCDEVIVMENGKIVYNDVTSTVLTNLDLPQHGANVPEVTTFGHAMKEAGKTLRHMPITVDEAIQLLKVGKG